MTLLRARVDALGPLLFRDARPFTGESDETRARSLEAPLPSTLAGLLRTVVGDALGWDWGDPQRVKTAQGIRLVRYWLTRAARGVDLPELPKPSSALVIADEGGRPRLMRLTPGSLGAGEGCDLPDPGLYPLVPTDDGKPVSRRRWWPWPDLEAWLARRDVLPDEIGGPVRDERVQIEIDRGTGTVKEGRLFTTEYRAWESWGRAREFDGATPGVEEAPADHVRWALEAVIHLPDDCPADGLVGTRVAHFGGEPPVVVTLSTVADAARLLGPQPGAELSEALRRQKRLTCQLVTPGVFADGWRPGWLTGGPSVHPALAEARLVGAAVPRREPVSGWSYERGSRGPKATRWMVPAGATFFLELDRALTGDELDNLWWASVCDAAADRDDGFGLAVWGLWNGEGS